ncbi:putative Holliday junction resolvase [Gordonia effusa NBRC 100432]|uniref:Putative pre-16S rRNA nuclease n=1 Tax=Gordonia effusa NBRC 100432 TaxID=1077974 RepID=H0QZJ7_9ACTN|nr:Holliday junction resolvase RuvX [Gordonia effusa]GAB18248.1 putative Holliday junction resolvase [Gordonia effusa NBRC 100432]
MTWVRGRRLGIDVGTVRIGIAVCDPDGILATPVETVSRSRGKTRGSDLDRIAELVDEYEAVAVIVGLPRNLAGEESFAADAVRAFGTEIEARISPVPLEYFDERMTTASASRALRSAGVSAKSARSVIDQAAAVAILQGWLDFAR